MANREACELYIEQEIKSGIEQGKKPYSIGKELSAWVEKLFEVNIKPRTIEQRARRIEDATNVAKESNTETKPVSYEPQENSVTHPPTDRGGKRKNAGRKPKPRIDKSTIISDEFIKAYENLYEQVQRARLEKWKTTSKEAAAKHVGYIMDLINA